MIGRFIANLIEALYSLPVHHGTVVLNDFNIKDLKAMFVH